MLLIIAPSKTQEKEPLPVTKLPSTMPQFLGKSAQLICELQKISQSELAQLMKTSPKLTEATYRLIHNFTTPFHQHNAHPALYSFQGDAYAMIECGNYDEKELDHAQNHLIILSGLYGILRPLDLMQPYRLEMGLKFSPLQKKNLYQFWQEDITTAVIKELEQKEEKSIINLASNEYAKVLMQKRLQQHGCRFITITFQQPHAKAADGYKTIPIHSKRARGMMVDFMIKNSLNSAEQLQNFTKNGYRFSTKHSTENNWIFRQKE